MVLVNKRVRVEDIREGMSVDLEKWYESQHSKEYLERISLAYNQVAEGEWHNEDNDECDGEDSCDCPEPSEEDATEGEVYQALVSSFIEIEDVEEDANHVYLSSHDELPEDRTFKIEKGTILPTDQHIDTENDGQLQPTKAPMVQRVTW
jgi:hypothetical protein